MLHYDAILCYGISVVYISDIVSELKKGVVKFES